MSMLAQTSVSAAPSGPDLFARFAYPPNALGYCGPGDPAGLLGAIGDRSRGRELAEQARQFAGAWPYLQLIAAANRRADPLDRDVVEAYWLGNRLLQRVPADLFAAHLGDRFRARAGAGIADLSRLAGFGAVPHHNFHVFAVYPWVGLLRGGHAGPEPLRVLNSCRVRWGRVIGIHSGPNGGQAEVRGRPLVWDGRRLWLGPPQVEVVVTASAGATLVPQLRCGDVVAMHWDWVCRVLSRNQVTTLRRYTVGLLRLTNEALARPVAAAVLD